MGAGDLVNNVNIAANPYTKIGVQSANDATNADAAEKLKAYLTGQQKQADVGLDLQKAQGVEDINLSGAKNRTEMAKQLVEDGAGRGIKYTANIGKDASLISQNETDPATKAAQRAKQEGGVFDTAATKAYSPINTQLEAISRTHDLLDNGDKISDKQVATNMARLAEGPGQRLLQSVIASVSGGKTFPGGITEASNWLQGKAESGFTPEERNAIRKNLITHAHDLASQADAANADLGKRRSVIAPDLPDSVVEKYGVHARDLVGKLSDREKSFLQQSQGNVTPPGAAVQQYQTPPTLGSALSDWWHGKGATPAPAPMQQAPAGNVQDLVQQEIERRKKAKGGS